MVEARSAQDRIQELVFGLSSESEEERKLCLTWLAQIGTEDVLPHLERLTQDPAVGVYSLARQLAAEVRERLELAKDHPWGHDPVVLLAHSDPRARLAGAMIGYDKQSDALKDALVVRLEVEEDAFVRASIVKALRHYADPRVLELLADHLLDPDARVRSNTVEALMTYEHPALLKRVSHLLHDPDMRVQGTVLIYLAKRMPERIRPLMEKMAESPEAWARRTARYAYRALGWEPPDDAAEAEGTSAVRDALASRDHEARVQAVWKALELPIEERLEALRRALGTEEHPHVIATLTRSLGHPGHTEDLPLLAKYLTSADARVRANTVEGVARIGGADALHLLEPLEEDASPRVRSAVLLALEKLRKRRAMGALRSLLDSEVADDLSKVVLELAHMPKAEVEQVLETAARAWDPARRRQVVDLLGGVKLHGQAQAFAEELCARWGSKVSGAIPAPSLSSDSKLALQGAQVLRLWEAGRLTDEELKPAIAQVEQAEEEIAQGRMVQEAIKRRHEALVKLARAAKRTGEKDGKMSSLTRRIAVLRADQIPVDARVVPLGVNTGPVGVSLGPPPLPAFGGDPFGARAASGATPVPGSGATPLPGSVPAAGDAAAGPVGDSVPRIPPRPVPAAVKDADLSALSYLPGGFRRIGGGKAGIADTAAGKLLILGIIAALGAVGMVIARAAKQQPPPPPKPPRPSVSAASPVAPAAPASASPAIARLVTRTGRIVEIRDDGLKLVLDVDGSSTVVTLRKHPRKDPKIGDFLTVTGTVAGAASGGLEQLSLDALPDQP